MALACGGGLVSEKRVYMVSLGCPKNRVDSEVMVGHLDVDGYQVTDDVAAADVIVVNTCAFIDAAKEESVNAILEMAQHKQQHGSKLLVAGCLSQRYAGQLREEIPEIDHFLGTGNFDSIARVLRSDVPAQHKLLPIMREAPTHPRLRGKNKLIPFTQEGEGIFDPDFTLSADSPRLSSLPVFTTYLKISEGCSNTCAFCIIPKLRGPQRSRSIDDICLEMERQLALGTVEFNLIAQDLCAYGQDQSPKTDLAALLSALNETADKAKRPIWIRSLYAYPRGLSDAVMDALANAPHILPYLDMPLQHISDGLLTRMRRGKGGEATKDLLRKLRLRVPGLTLRTTFITGLPGETDADFSELMDFVKEMRFEHMGVFAYSQEEDTPAATMEDQVDAAVAQERRDALMSLQKTISAEAQDAMIGKRIPVIIEGISDETDLLLQGRHEGQAPDIDGLTYVTDGLAAPGEIVEIEVEQASDYDIAGPIVDRIMG